ncbi:hydantoinase B/oxoprolinase family protein [Patulibacter defluvii]|uniref:hydantoinase B/oxoprolinase family protein n=1 Tax=Patulibacter defluvii TaxID=3095358 RepID=UPI002A757645|nr:hydantoinase B/oxoprolinase family protein [Patulibacter sp. DM4]
MSTPTADGVDLALYASRFAQIVDSMANTLFRSARSGVINTAHDFSCCLVDHREEMVAATRSIPIHVMSGPELLTRAMKRFHPTLRRGDAFLHNSPYHGNSHAADHTLLVPVVDDDGRHRFTVVAKAHQADCGNAEPTTYYTEARDVYAEGALIFPCVKIQEDYRDNEDLIRMCEARMRVPEQWRGDYLALVGSARIGERLLRELADEVGWDEVAAQAEAWCDYGERRMAAAIARMPAGEATCSTVHDPFPGCPDGVPIRASVRIDPDAARIAVDLTDNPDCLPNGLNLTESTSRTAALIGIWTTVGGDVPSNGGAFRRIDVALREGCCVGIPVHPHSCSVATTNLATRTANTVSRAMAEIGEGLGTADHGLILPPSAAVVSGLDPRHDDAPFVNMLILAGSGGAAAPREDAWLTTGDVGTLGMLRRDSVEIDELRFPLCVETQRIIPDSEGAGRFRGTPGTLVEITALGTDVVAHWASDGHVHGPQGVRGGGPGGPADQRLRTPDGQERPLPAYGAVTIHDGDTVISICTGGGGYGPPTEREPERVARDVREGWVTPERAREVYRVAVDTAGVVDAATTATLRGGPAAG